MTIPHSLISEAAEDYLKRNKDIQRSYEKAYAKNGFQEGAQWLHSHLMNEAAEGFEEWWSTPDQLSNKVIKELAEQAWQASQLHSQRRMEEMKKDMEWALRGAEQLYGKEPELHQGMCPTFYHTLTYEGDLELIKKAQEIRKKWGLE